MVQQCDDDGWLREGSPLLGLPERSRRAPACPSCVRQVHAWQVRLRRSRTRCTCDADTDDGALRLWPWPPLLLRDPVGRAVRFNMPAPSLRLQRRTVDAASIWFFLFCRYNGRIFSGSSLRRAVVGRAGDGAGSPLMSPTGWSQRRWTPYLGLPSRMPSGVMVVVHAAFTHDMA